MKVGDIITYAHHYSARIPEFARVIKATEKSVWLEHLDKKWVSHDGYGQNGDRVPNLDGPTRPFKGCFRIKTRKDGTEFIKVNSYCYGYIWDGTPEAEWTD